MSATEVFWIFIAIVCANYLINLWLGYLNTLTWSDNLPEQLTGIYNPDRYRLQQSYQKENYRFGIVTSFLSFGIIILLLATGTLGSIDSFVKSLSSSPVIQGLLFLGITGMAADILSIPAEIYDTFVIETKYGFNKTTLHIYITDKIKGWLLAATIGSGLIAGIIFLYTQAGPWFWILAWVVITLFTLALTYFYTSLLLPVFNKLTPLADGELKDSIRQYCLGTGYKLSGIFLMDGSRRSSKANAFFSGFGAKKKVVLYDTLVAAHPPEEIVAILAHEIGHYKKKHIVKGLITGILQTGLLLFLCQWFIGSPVLAEALGSNQSSFHIGIVAFGILYSPFSLVSGIVMNFFSRKHEYEADAYAARTSDGIRLKSALIRLSTDNLSNLTPHPWYVFVHYSHPTLLQRMKALENQAS